MARYPLPIVTQEIRYILMDLKLFGQQLQHLRKEAGLSQEQLVAALDALAQAGLTSDYRVIDGTLISRWEQARVQKGRQWRPTRPYVLHLIHLFAGHLTSDSAQEWAVQAGYKLTAGEVHALFPITTTAAMSTALTNSNTQQLTNTASLLHSVVTAKTAAPTPEAPRPITPTLEISDMPVTAHFHGRTAEVATVEGWLYQGSGIRLVAVLGMGGMGKTALTAHIVARVPSHFPEAFRIVLWRSLLNAPPLSEVLRSWLPILSRQTLLTLPASQEEQLQLLLQLLRQERCLLVLDNLESILQGGEAAGVMRPGYEAYAQLLQTVGSTYHNSCLLLTSREHPQTLDLLLRNTATTRVLSVGGLDPQAGEALLHTQGLTLLSHQATSLVQHYSGNPLALKIVASAITDWFAGDLEAFQREGAPVFDDIRAVLDQQFARLSELERELLVWLAIEREAVTAPVLRENLVQKWPSRSFLEALHSLERRSLLIKQGDGFTLQNVVMEYTTDRLITAICTELSTGRADDAQGQKEGFTAPQLALSSTWFNRYTLLKAQAKEYIRQSQERLIVQPLVEQMVTQVGHSAFIKLLNQWLAALRAARQAQTAPTPGYAGGNLLNLLRYLAVDLTGYDFSGLALWQAYLQGIDLPAVNLAHADLRGCVFTKNFGLCRVLAFAPDGNVLAGGMTNGEIHLWQPDDGQPVAMIKVHETRIWDLAFSPDSQWIVSGSKDQTVCVTDRATGASLRRFTGHTDWVRTVAFHPGGQIVASGGQDQTVRLWDLKIGHALHTLLHEGWVLDLAFSPDGAYLASAGTDQKVYLWAVATGEMVAVWHEHGAAVYTVNFSPDGALLATGSDDRTLRLWDVAAMVRGEPTPCRTVLTGHQAGIYVAAFSTDGQWLFSGGAEAVMHVWDVTTGQPLHTLIGHQREVNSLTISPSGKMLATGEADTSMVYLWDLNPQPRARYARLGYRNWTNAVAFHPRLPLLAGASANGKVDLWHATTGHYLQTLPGAKSMSRALTFSGAPLTTVPTSGIYLAAGSTDGTVRLWLIDAAEMLMAAQQRTIQTITAPRQILQVPKEIHAVTFSAEPFNLFAGSYDGTVHWWDGASGQHLHTFHLPGDPRIKSIAVSPDGQYLAVVGHNATVALWHIATQKYYEIQGHTAWIWTVAFHPGGNFLASGSFDRTVRLWQMPTGALHYTLPHLTSLVQVIAFSPSGNRLAVGMGDATIYLWATEGLSQTPPTAPMLISKVQGHADLIQGLAFSSDDTLLASASLDGTIKVWEMAGLSCLHTLRAPGPYAGMKISGVTGITAAQQEALEALGATST